MNNKNAPFFSIIMPTYNRAYCIERAIKSVINQDFHDFELLVEDDASTDSTENIISAINDGRIHYNKFDKNSGAPAARNRGVKRSIGQYLMFLDSDDELTPGALKIMAERISKGKENYRQFAFQQVVAKESGIENQNKEEFDGIKEISYEDSLMGRFHGLYVHGVISSDLKDLVVFEERCISYLNLTYFDLKKKFGPVRLFQDIVKVYHRDNTDTITASLRKKNKEITRNSAIQSMLFINKFGQDMLKLNSSRYFFEHMRAAENLLLLKKPAMARYYLKKLRSAKKANISSNLLLCLSHLLDVLPIKGKDYSDQILDECFVEGAKKQ